MTSWPEILESARFAPSPHNTQPWKVKVIEAVRADVLLVRERMLPDEDTTGSFILCAMGIFLESVRIIAANRGCALDVEPIELNDGAALAPYARLSLHAPGSAAPSAISDNLF